MILACELGGCLQRLVCVLVARIAGDPSAVIKGSTIMVVILDKVFDGNVLILAPPVL